MGRNKIRHFSLEEKTKIVLALLKEDSTLVELSSKHGVTSKTLQNWKRQFLENASVAFDPSKIVSVYKDEIETLKHQNDELAKALGKTTVERDWAVVLNQINNIRQRIVRQTPTMIETTKFGIPVEQRVEYWV